jgi:hypothetical protein
MSSSIFEVNYGGHICFIVGVDDRLKKVKECTDIKALKGELNKSDMNLQATVRKAIESRIQKLDKAGKR